MDDKEKFPHLTRIEILSGENEGLPPKIDWSKLPPHIRPERAVDYFRHLKAIGLDESSIQRLIENIRFLDVQATNEAVKKLAIRAQEIIGDSEFCFVYYGDPGETGKSGHWISTKLQSNMDTRNCLFDRPLAVSEFVELVVEGVIPPNTRVIVADDLAIFYEQINDHIVGPIIDKLGPSWGKNMVIALLAGTNQCDKMNTSNLSKVGHILRVYDIPTMDKIGLSNFRNAANGYITFFFHHRVSDRFYPPCLRSVGTYDGDGFHYLVDDMRIAPDYDPDRFTTGSWAAKAGSTQV